MVSDFALSLAVEAQRLALRWAKARGASHEVLAVMQTALEHILGECARVGVGSLCECGSPLAEHDIDAKRIYQFRDGHGMLWGDDELCSGFRPVSAQHAKVAE